MPAARDIIVRMSGAGDDLGDGFVNLEGIPVLETGIEYPASTGTFTVTSAMLAEAVTSQDDPHILPPRIKIGHSENPINDDLQELWEEVNDGRDESQPSLGTIQNLRVSEHGQTLIGDFYGLPQWLASILKTAYPARSIEGGSWKNDANDRSYSFMIEAVALLGVVGPGCTSLDDLQELFSAEGPKVTVIEMARGGQMPVEAQVNVEDIRRAFYEDFAQGDQYWWWDRELLIDPLEMIVEDPDEGQLYIVPIDLDSSGEGPAAVTFGESQPVKVQYIPDDEKKKEGEKASRLIAPQLGKAGKVLAVNSTPPRERERRKEDGDMPPINIPALRAALDVDETVLPDDASEERINEVLAESGEQREPEQPETPEEEPETPEGEPETPEEEEPETPEGDGTERVDSATLAQLRQQAALGAQAREQQMNEEQERIVDDAIKAGKFPPSRREHWLKLLKSDPDGTKATISDLAEGTVPVGDEVGGSPSESVNASSYPDSWLSPSERGRISAAREGDRPLVTKEA